MGIYVLNRTGRLLKPHHEAHLGGGCLFGEGCFLKHGHLLEEIPYLLCFNISWGWGYTVWEWRAKNGKDSGVMRAKKIKIEINCSSECNKTRFCSSIKLKSRLWHKHSDVFYQTFSSNKDFEIFWKLILAHMTGNWEQNYENISCPPLHLENALKE